MNLELKVKKYPQEGDLQHTYSPLKNKLTTSDDSTNNSIVDFTTNELRIDLSHPLNIECQPSYDGTVNLIVNDDVNPPRIINSRFSKIEDHKFKTINRNQTEQTNLYKENEIDLQTRLFRNVSKLPKLDFVELNYFGILKGGNYTFYIKYADSDYNKTDIICESGQVSVFKGSLFDIKSISGTLLDESTDKSIKLLLSNIDESFSKFYIYYTREYSDLNGFLMSETVSLINPYEIKGKTQEIIINGYEESSQISDEELNVQYNYVTNVKTQAQVQNMLFFGNVESDNPDIKNLQNISYFFNVDLKQKDATIGWINPITYEPNNFDLISLEYYDPKNIYYNLGYWPEEIYRLGVVYIMKDDSLSPVFNLRGCEFKEPKSELVNWTIDTNRRDGLDYKIFNSETNKWEINYLERDSFLSGEGFKQYDNTYGVFKNPREGYHAIIQNQDQKKTRPWYYQISIDHYFVEELKKYNVKGLFFVRQKRIPTTLCQGVSLGIDKSSSIPMLYDGSNYFTESFLTDERTIEDFPSKHKIKCDQKFGSALLSMEASTNPLLQSELDGGYYLLQKVKGGGGIENKDKIYAINHKKCSPSFVSYNCVYMESDIPYKYLNGYGFSTRAGVSESVMSFGFFGKSIYDHKEEVSKAENRNLIRGIYAPYVGVCGNLEDNALYNIKIQNYSTNHLKDYFMIRANDNSAFYAISDRYGLDEFDSEVNNISVYRGDCFTNTVTFRLNRNFTDPDYPIVDTIIDKDTWKSHYNGFYATTKNDKDAKSDDTPDGNWALINRGDINAVPLGTWVSYKCLSNRNLGIRSEDYSYPEEVAVMGNPRSFYPLNDASTKSANKIPESFIVNSGYSSTVGRKTNIEAPNVPYIKDLFDNRVMFSQVQVDGDFRNAYRVFQGLSYTDIDRQYGAIVKFVPWGVNILCVFEHGLGIIPINEKALIQTTTDQSIHMYGAGVVQNQISLITSDYGSNWPESIIRTPIGVYGVDTYAKKIWRYTDKNGFETISDMKIQRFLNDNIILHESDKYPIIALKNVKTHYNNYKGDVMFTFYNFIEGKEWNFCFNERMNKWITRYSWTPLYSENINNIFYSLDKKRAEVLAYIYDNKKCTYGIRTTKNEWDIDESGELTDVFSTNITLQNVQLTNEFELNINSIKTSYLTDSGEEIFIEIPKGFIDKNVYLVNNKEQGWELSWKKKNMQSILQDKNLTYDTPLYYKIDITARPQLNIDGTIGRFLQPINRVIGIVVNFKYNPDEYKRLLCNGFYVHGRSGIFDEIDYFDENQDNDIKPTKWYNKQEPFEFEFVVNEPTGLHKIFDNLIIISNKVEPKSIEFEIIGDVYDFKKLGLLNETEFKSKTTIKYDPILNQKTLLTEQDCKNIEKVGRRLGNIHYKEDSWYLTIEPIRFKNEKNPDVSSTRIRDKYIKIRVKYDGKDPVIITSLKTICTLSSS